MKKIKLFDPVIRNEERNAVRKVLDSHFWASGSGINKVENFEKKFKKYIKSEECVAVNSGTAALNLALSLSNIKNKEVIVPSLTFVSTVNAIKLNGGIPIFCDVNLETGCISVDDIRKRITKKTVAVLPVHFAGLSCEIKSIQQICKNHKLDLIEDAAHAAGSTSEGMKIGSHGKLVCFSFHPAKNLAMPTGGLIAINDPNYKKIKNKLNSSRWCGITDRKGVSYDVREIGNNYYMNEISAAIGIEQLKKLDKMNDKRKKIAKKYEQKINLESKIPFDKNCSYHIYWILVKNRTNFIKKMNENKIEVGIHYKPVHQMTLYKHSTKLPITEKMGKSIVSLPIHPNLTNVDVERIISIVNNFAK